MTSSVRPDPSEFSYTHLPPHLREASLPYAELADSLVRDNEPGGQLDMALHYLLLSKDAAVRARKNSLRVYDVGDSVNAALVFATSPQDAMNQCGDLLRTFALQRPAEPAMIVPADPHGISPPRIMAGMGEYVPSFTKLEGADLDRTVPPMDVDGFVTEGPLPEEEVSIRSLVRQAGGFPRILWNGKRKEISAPVVG